MNPRKTFIEDVMDEFAAEQRIPIESSTTTTSSTSSSLSLSMSSFSSSHSHASNSYHSSTHSNASTASYSSASSSIFTSSFTFLTMKSEDEQLSFAMGRIIEAYQEYLRIHDAYNTIVSRREHNPMMNPSSTTNNHQLTASKYTSNLITHDELLMCFREVPEIFFRPEFTLQNIDMFNLAMGTKFGSVTPIAAGNTRTPIKKSLDFGHDNEAADSSMIQKQHQIPKNQQEQLTKYLDIIELALLNNIWIRSPSFFRVLDDIRALQTLVSAGYSHLSSLRSRYRGLSETIAVTILRIPKLHTRQRNQSLLYDKLTSMQRIMQGQSTIVNLVEMEDFTSALALVREMKDLYHQELSRVACMKEIGAQLDKYDSFISEVMCNKFVSVAIQFEDEPGSLSSAAAGSGAVLDDLTAASTAGGEESSPSLSNNESFDQLLRSLILMDKLKISINMYKSRLSDSVRMIVRTCILEYLSSFDPTLVVDALENSDSASSNNQSSENSAFATRVREMSNENFLSCVSMCYENVLLAIQKADMVHRFIESKLASYQREESVDRDVQEFITNTDASATTSTAAAPSSKSWLPNDSNLESMIGLSKSCLTTACDLAQRSIVQLLNIRKDSYGRMTGTLPIILSLILDSLS
jgi:hypothetical protein